jgi:hypothetical protein
VSTVEARGSSCTDPRLHEALTSYCFGDSDEAEFERVQEHLLACDVCWREVQALEASVRALRHDPNLVPLSVTPEVIGLFGVSGQIHAPLTGHLRFVAFMSVLYGLLFAESIVTEVAYAFDRYGLLGLRLVPLVFLVVAVVLASAFTLDGRLTRAGRRDGFSMSALALALGMGLGLGTLVFWLPGEAVVRATFQTRTVASGYLKNAIYYFLPLGLLLVLPTFHSVVALQHELVAGRHARVLALLSGDRDAVPPHGMLFVRPRTFAGLLGLGAAWAVLSSHYLLDHLLPGPYAGLYSMLLEVQLGIFFTLGVGSLIWYSRCLTELKRECLAVKAISGARATPMSG